MAPAVSLVAPTPQLSFLKKTTPAELEQITVRHAYSDTNPLLLPAPTIGNNVGREPSYKTKTAGRSDRPFRVPKGVAASRCCRFR